MARHFTRRVIDQCPVVYWTPIFLFRNLISMHAVHSYYICGCFSIVLSLEMLEKVNLSNAILLLHWILTVAYIAAV